MYTSSAAENFAPFFHLIELCGSCVCVFSKSLFTINWRVWLSLECSACDLLNWVLAYTKQSQRVCWVCVWGCVCVGGEGGGKIWTNFVSSVVAQRGEKEIFIQ